MPRLVRQQAASASRTVHTTATPLSITAFKPTALHCSGRDEYESVRDNAGEYLVNQIPASARQAAVSAPQGRAAENLRVHSSLITVRSSVVRCCQQLIRCSS
ncbi:hypothetical protein [Endozoicomonas sp. SESOKO1]|uniref:hypothetical protein n=1 Tax=Endozoicomonas sp. SESOKO1 TaxID=2828742 RepID=UPI00214931AC|nr:hypothetical protein [Endozoicomonas sp. SESOKO1]